MPVSWLLASEGDGFSIFRPRRTCCATGDNTFDGVACLDLTGCYSLDIVPPSSNSGSQSDNTDHALTVGDDVGTLKVQMVFKFYI